MSTAAAHKLHAPADGDAQPQHPNAQSNAWGEIPEALVRDPSVKEAELVLTAYRATFTRTYVMREGEIRANPPVKVVEGRSGLGKNATRRAIAAMKARGTITRQVPRRGEYVEERLALDALATGYLRVWRWWFSAVLTLKAMAAWLFLQAGTGKGPVVWAREIRARFGWDPKTCGKVMGELDASGLLSTTVDRSKGGAYRGVGYQAKVWEKRGSEKPGMGKTGQHTKDSPLTDNLPHESATSPSSVTYKRLARGADPSHGKLADADCRMFLQRLTTADTTEALASRLRRNARGLGLFLQAMAAKYGVPPERAVQIMETRLAEYGVRGKPVEAEAEMNWFATAELYDGDGPGWLKTWSYFERYIPEESERLDWHERANQCA